MSVILFLQVLALVLILLAALKVPEPPRISYGWMGVFLFLALQLIKI